MKKLSILSALFGLFFIGTSFGADITIYHSPYCPHCHHARDFIGGQLIYQYPKLKVVEVDVMVQENLPKFQEVLEKCKFDNGGVPVIVVGEKCFHGYADFMQEDLRKAVEADMSEDDIKTAKENKKAFDADPEKFKADNSERLKAISEYKQAAANAENEKKNEVENNSIYFWALLGVLVVAFGFVLLRKKK